MIIVIIPFIFDKILPVFPRLVQVFLPVFTGLLPLLPALFTQVVPIAGPVGWPCNGSVRSLTYGGLAGRSM
jgi:hypothetical protein